jgi:hypothetical protein
MVSIRLSDARHDMMGAGGGAAARAFPQRQERELAVSGDERDTPWAGGVERSDSMEPSVKRECCCSSRRRRALSGRDKKRGSVQGRIARPAEVKLLLRWHLLREP